MAVFSSYFWSGFPYDNLCENEGTEVHPMFVGEYSIPVPKKTSNLNSILALYGGGNETSSVDDNIEYYYKNVTIEAGWPTYRFCNQDMLGRGRDVTGAYPFVPVFQPTGDEWMTEEQTIVCTYYGWLSFFFA